MRACVIMSVYKGDQVSFIKEALGSLYNQTQKADIFIKVDGPVDIDLLDFLHQERKKGNIAYLDIREKNLGLAYSLNELVEEGLKQGYEYFFRMDADDIAMPQRFDKQLSFMAKNPDIDVCGTFIEEFGEGYRKVVRYPLTHNEMLKFFQKRVPLPHVSACFRKSYFQKAGLYPVKGHITNEDTLMWLQGFKDGCKFANVDYIGVKVRVSDDFFNRRATLKKVWYDFKNRLQVNKELGFGPMSYMYAIAVAMINLLPPKLKRVAYKYLR